MIGRDDAGIADLAAGLAVERRLVDDDLHFVAAGSLSNGSTVLDDRLDDAFGALGGIAEKLACAMLFAQLEPDGFCRLIAGAGPMRARFGLLALHGIGEAAEIDADFAGAQRILRQVEREAVGVVKLESGLAVEHVTLAKRGR